MQCKYRKIRRNFMVSEGILRRQDSEAKLCDQEECIEVWEERGTRVWAPFTPRPHSPQETRGTRGFGRSTSEGARQGPSGGAPEGTTLDRGGGGGGRGVACLTRTQSEGDRVAGSKGKRRSRVRFVRCPDVAFYQRLDILDLVGDHRDAEGNPNYAFLGVVRITI
eukprot:1181696-Prorocentrum_minimum.AAC.2